MIQQDRNFLKLLLQFIIVACFMSYPFKVYAEADCKYQYHECIGASDLGVNLVYTIKALPKYQDDYYLTLPKDSQVILWKEAGIYTTGATSDIDVRSKLKIYVEGSWAPWGHCPEKDWTALFLNETLQQKLINVFRM